MRGTTLSILLVSSLGACVADGYSTDVSALGGENLNGENLNGENLNGENLNGSELGKAVKWVELAGATLDGSWLPFVWLDGSQLMGWQGGPLLEGDALVGARFVARSDTNKWLKLRVSEVEAPQSSDDGGDVWRYWVEYLETNGQWYPICLDADGDAFGAIPVDGYWNHKRGVPHGGDKVDDPWRFTFACPRVGAIGKCVDAGYEPWAYAADGTSLADHHQACVRLMRADYCGDGEPHTVDGTLVNLYDQIGIQDDVDEWIHEAEWGPDGASCISPHNRHVEPVKCYDRLIRDDCGSSFSDGTLLISETPADAE